MRILNRVVFAVMFFSLHSRLVLFIVNNTQDAGPVPWALSMAAPIAHAIPWQAALTLGGAYFVGLYLLPVLMLRLGEVME